MFKNSIQLLAILLTLFSCEYQYNYTYLIENVTDKTYNGKLTTLIDTTNITLSANTTSEVFTFFGGIEGKNFQLGDRRDFKWELDSLYLKTSDTTRSKNLADKNLWDFESKNREGIYKLTLTEALLN